jgi:hypothetical protein
VLRAPRVAAQQLARLTQVHVAARAGGAPPVCGHVSAPKRSGRPTPHNSTRTRAPGEGCTRNEGWARTYGALARVASAARVRQLRAAGQQPGVGHGERSGGGNAQEEVAERRVRRRALRRAAAEGVARRRLRRLEAGRSLGRTRSGGARRAAAARRTRRTRCRRARRPPPRRRRRRTWRHSPRCGRGGRAAGSGSHYRGPGDGSQGWVGGSGV